MYFFDYHVGRWSRTQTVDIKSVIFEPVLAFKNLLLLWLEKSWDTTPPTSSRPTHTSPPTSAHAGSKSELQKLLQNRNFKRWTWICFAGLEILTWLKCRSTSKLKVYFHESWISCSTAPLDTNIIDPICVGGCHATRNKFFV
jgi:hypothetical protein